jgi:Hint domain
MSKEGIATGWRRTRRNVLGIGGILAGASFSRLGIKSAHAHDHDRERWRPSCFMRGTSILTPHGEQKIEDLRIGDLVVGRSGKAKQIEWIGRRLYRRAPGGRWVESIKPVRIAKGALGPGVPHRELFLSQEHCLFIDGIFISIADLVNGSSIAFYPATERDEIKYLHIKLTAHDIVFAEGAPSETLMLRDSVSIERYDNFVEYERLYGSKARTAEVPCAPIARMRGDRDRLRSRVRSALSPWLDRRNTFDKARDLLEERAFTTSATGSDFLQNLRNETLGVRAR